MKTIYTKRFVEFKQLKTKFLKRDNVQCVQSSFAGGLRHTKREEAIITVVFFNPCYVHRIKNISLCYMNSPCLLWMLQWNVTQCY